MALIKCVECGKEISDRADVCPCCGFPIKPIDYVIYFNWADNKGHTFLKTDVLIDDQPIGEMTCGSTMDCTVSEGEHEVKLLLRKKCVVQETIIVNRDNPEVRFFYKQTLTGLKRVLEDSIKRKYGLNVPTCPTCGSQNVKKLSMSGKVVGVGVFGLASGSVGKTFVCKNCGYKW